jgi:hypothetical protein
MASLSKNWVTEHLIDFEYKKYILLAYLQHVSSRFDEVRLYPSLGELVEHYQDLKSLQDSIRETSASFKTNLKGIQDSTLVYEPPPDDNISREIKSIIEFSLPLIEKTLRKTSPNWPAPPVCFLWRWWPSALIAMVSR